MEDKKEIVKDKNWIKEIIPYILIIIAILLVKKYVVTTVVVHGESMTNTLHDKDIMILDKISLKFQSIKRFDIIVIDTGDTKIIKRVIGLPGETIEYFDNKLYIDGEEVKDKYGKDATSDIEQTKIGDNEYYVLGDNRGNSVDSRIIGLVNKKDILGKATFIIYPFNRIGSK